MQNRHFLPKTTRVIISSIREKKYNMQLFKRIFSFLSEKTILAGSVLFALIPLSPVNMPMPYTDSGVFLYFGWRILNGELPYRDIWDHKPPLIYYIDALGLSITPNSQWGVWIIECICLLITVFLLYAILKKIFGPLPSIYLVIFGIIALTKVIDGGNNTEEYALPLQALVLWLIFKIKDKPFSFWKWFLIGLTGTIAFFIKQTTIGLWVSIIIYTIISECKDKHFSRLLRKVASFSVGALLISVSIVMFFGLQNSLIEFINAAFKYNYIYSIEITSFAKRLIPLIDGISPLASEGMLLFSLIGYFLGIIFVLNNDKQIDHWKSLLIVLLIDLPLEFALVCTSGHSFGHYFINFIPTITLFTGITFNTILKQFSISKITKKVQVAFNIIILVTIIWCAIPSYKQYIQFLSEPNNSPEVIDYVIENSTQEDSILFWGADTDINFQTRRVSPTRYVYQYPLYKINYTNETRILEFLDDIIRNKPKFIFNTKNPYTPMFKFPIITDDISARIEMINSMYSATQDIGLWTIYTIKE